jgi:hypothetical protein
MEPYQLQHDRPVSWVIAQQYSSATCVSYSFRSLKEKFATLLNKQFNFFIIFNSAILKLLSLKFS